MKKLETTLFLVASFFSFHCSHSSGLVTNAKAVMFDFPEHLFFKRVLSVTMQLWAQLNDDGSLLLNDGMADDILGKLYRLKKYVDTMKQENYFVYEEDKAQLIILIDSLRYEVGLLENNQTEYPTIFLFLLHQIEHKIKLLNTV